MCKLNQRELCQALGKVIVKVLRTHVSGDTDEVPQRWRSTAYARRQWAAAPTAKDVEHVDHAADEVHEQAQGIVIDDVRVDAHNFPGEPHDTSVLIEMPIIFQASPTIHQFW